MRRSRISVKPNFRPGGRGVAAGDQASRVPADADNTLPPVAAEDAVGPSPSPQEVPSVEKPTEAAGFEKAPNSPAQEASANLSNGAPSSGTRTPAAVPQRRMRILATPKLSGPKATSTPRPPRSALSAFPKEPPVQISDSVLEITMPGSTAPTEVAKQASKTHKPPSPCEPSTSGLLTSPDHEKKSSRDSPPSPQPGQVPQQPPHEPEPVTDTPSAASDMPSAQVKLSRLEPGSPQKGTGMSSDREKILRALKLKELMKIERRKDIQKGKRKVKQKSEYTPSDRNKMTMRDLIYYLPDTSPMRSSTVNEEDQAETIVPLSPKMPEKTPERRKEEEDDDFDEESEEEDMLVPKVRVAEDGSIILDEESLTVRVQRASKTKVVESTALFERGSTSTYSSYRSLNHVKPWSVRETDMFYLAISMVGTDFSLIGQLMPHRCRAEVKNKFKKEEKANSWRIDKAFRNKRPYDREFFSFLLEKVLAKDKEKGKSVKLVLTKPKRRAKARGKKAKDNEENCLHASGADEDLDIEDDGGCVDAEKENEGLPNGNKAEKKRKRTSEVENKDKCEEQGKKKKRKRAKKTKTDIHVPEGDAEGECGLFNADCDPVNANKEDEHGSRIPAPKKKRRCSKKAEDNNEAFIEGSKGKRHRKSLKVGENPEDSIVDNEENTVAVEEDTGAAMKKRKRSREGDPKGSKQNKEAKSTKRKRSRRKKGIVEDEGTAEDEEASASAEVGEASATAEVGEASATAEIGEVSEVGEASVKKIDTADPAELMGKGSRRSARKPKRAVPNLTTKRQKKTSKSETTDDGIQESQNENDTIFTLEGGIIPSETEQVQKQAVVVLEKTPPRVKNPLSSFEVQGDGSESVSSMSRPVSPAVSESSSGQKMRMQRAERVKRCLTAKKIKGKTKATFNQDESEHIPETSTEDIKSPTVLLEQMVTQESEETEAGNSLDEDLIDLSCLDHLNSQTFQRRPMVVLSREEVDMVLNTQHETSEGDPSVSPLDLSLNTELSFQLQCSNILPENTEADHVETDANGYGPQDRSSSSAFEKHFEDTGLNEPALDQFISIPANVSSLKSSEGSSQGSEVATSSSVKEPEQQLYSSTDTYMTTTANEPEVSPTLPASEHPIHTQSDAPVTDEAVIIPFPDVVACNALLASRGVVEDSKASLPEIREDSQRPLLASPEVMARSLGSITAMPENKGRVQESILATQEIKEGSIGSTVLTPEIKEASPAVVERMQGSVLATPDIKEISKGFVVAKPEIQVGSHGSVLSTLELKEGPEGLTVAVPLVKEDSQGADLPGSLLTPSEDVKRSKKSVVVTPEIKCRPRCSVVAASLAKKYSQEEDMPESILASSEVVEISEIPVVEAPEMESSQGFIVRTPEIKDGPESSAVAATVAREYSQEKDLLGSMLATSEVVERSGTSLLVTSEVKESSQGSIMGTPVIKDGKEGSVVAAPLAREYSQEEDTPGSMLASSEVVEKSKMPVVVTPEMKENTQGPIVGTSVIKDGKEGTLLVGHLAKEDSQEEELPGSVPASSDILERSKKSVVITPESSQGSIVGTLVIKDGKEGSAVAAPLVKEYSQGTDSPGSLLTPSEDVRRSKSSVVVTPELKESSQGSTVGTPEIKDEKGASVLAAPLDKEDSQKEELLGSMLASSEVVERSDMSVVVTPEIMDSSQGSIVGTPKIKDRPGESMVAAKEYSQEEAKETVLPSTKLSSGASVSSEHAPTLKRRSRFLKPKPNLIGASKTKHAEPRKISSEKIIPQNTDEGSSMERDKEKSCAVDLKSESRNSSLILGPAPPAEVSVEYSENQTANVSSCASPVVPEQDHIIPVTLSAATSEQASDTCHMDVKSSYVSVSEDLQMVNASCSWPLTTQAAELERIGHSEEICAPARIIQPAEDGNSEEEPTFVLTLYEIPVSDMHLPSASNETVAASPFLISDHPPLPSVSDSPRDSLSMDTGDIKKDCVDISLNESPSRDEESAGRLSTLEEKTVPGPGREHDHQTLAQSKSLHTTTALATNEAKEVSPNLQSRESESECKDGPESLLLEDLKPREQSTPFTFKASKCVASMPQDSEDAEQCEGVSQMVLPDIFVPVFETEDDLSMDSTLCEEEDYSTAESKPLFTDSQESTNTQSLSGEKKALARRKGKLQPKLVHRASGKRDPSKTSSQAVLPTSQQSIEPQATCAVSKKQEIEDISEAPKLQIIPKAKESSVLDPDLQQKHQMTPCTVILSRCVGSVHQDPCVVAASEERVDVCMELAAPQEKAAGIPRHKDTSSMTPTSSQEVKMPRRRAKIQVKPTLRKRTQAPQCHLEATESDSSHATSLGSQKPELEKEDTEISTKHVTADDPVKCEMVSSSEDQESSLSEAHEKANFLPSHFSEIMRTSCSPVDLDEDNEDCEGVSHMVLTDIFVPVSDEMGDDVIQDFLTPIENSPHKEEVSPPIKEVHLEKICKKEKPEKSKKSERPTKEKESRQQVKRTCAKKLLKSSSQELETVHVSGGPEVEPAAEVEGSSDLVNLEEKLKLRHQIIPCTVQVSRCTDFLPVEKESEDVSPGVLTDTVVPVSEEVGEDESKDCMKDSPLFTPLKGSNEQPILEETQSEESPGIMQKKCPSRKKGKLLVKLPRPKREVKRASKTEPPVSEGRAVNLPHTVSQTGQLLITAWAKKKSVQSGSKLEAEDLPKTSQSEPSFKDRESAGQTSTRSTQPSTSSGETETSRADVPHITSVPASQDPGEVGSEAESSTIKARHGAKPPVKPRLSKRMRAKEKGNSKKDKPLSARLSSPTRHTEAARVQEEAEQLPKKQITVSNTSRMETHAECEDSCVPASVPLSPRHSAVRPRVILPQVKVQTTETDSCFDSFSPTSSPVRVSTSTSQPMTAPQNKSPVVPSNQSGSPESSEDTEDEPTRVSQFFISDIFTEVEDGD